MFEGWAADLLATSLGRFVDVQKDKLRISLWSGEQSTAALPPPRQRCLAQAPRSH